MYTISKRFDFSAAHHLLGLPEEHPCSRVHGHNYSIELELCARFLNHVGFVVDYRALDTFKAMVDEWDHRDLNAALPQPTAENIAYYLWTRASVMFDDGRVIVSAVRVKETEKTCAEYRGYGPIDIIGVAMLENDERLRR